MAQPLGEVDTPSKLAAKTWKSQKQIRRTKGRHHDQKSAWTRAKHRLDLEDMHHLIESDTRNMWTTTWFEYITWGHIVHVCVSSCIP